jgi:O-antigen ligase
LTNLILFGGFGLAIMLAAAMLRPQWRLPALIVALLVLPGNMDNVWPQMQLDPHPIANNLAPVFTTADLLLVWALALSIRERRRLTATLERRLVLAALLVAGLATGAALVALSAGVEPAAAARGVVTFARVPAILFLVAAHANVMGDGRFLAAAFALGVLGLLANGVYTTATLQEARFTASTFGWNGFAVALLVGGLIVGGLAMRMSDGPPVAGVRRWLPIALAITAAAAFFGLVATGTRMALLVLPLAMVLAAALNRGWRVPGGWRKLAVAGAVVFVSVVASGLLTAEGNRALAVLTNPGQTVVIVTDPGSQPEFSPVRARTEFWVQATTLIRERPLTGVGPFQWNVERYRIDPTAPAQVVDPHNTYLQVAAEYGLIVTLAYLVLLGTTLAMTLLFAWQRRSLAATSWTATGFVVAALIFPLTEMTNSHFFNVRLGPIAWLLFASALVLARATMEGERLAPRLPSLRRQRGEEFGASQAAR